MGLCQSCKPRDEPAIVLSKKEKKFPTPDLSASNIVYTLHGMHTESENIPETFNCNDMMELTDPKFSAYNDYKSEMFLARFSVTLNNQNFPVFFMLLRHQLDQYCNINVRHNIESNSECQMDECIWCKVHGASIQFSDYYALDTHDKKEMAKWIVTDPQSLFHLRSLFKWINPEDYTYDLSTSEEYEDEIQNTDSDL